jgi:hypothetical protein
VIFGSRVYAQIRPVSVGDLEARTKYSKFVWFRLENCRFVLLAQPLNLLKYGCRRHRFKKLFLKAYKIICFRLFYALPVSESAWKFVAL